MPQYHKPTTIDEARQNPRYQGKIIVAAGGEVHGTYKEDRAVQLFRKLQRKYPQDPPTTTVIAKGPLAVWFYQLSDQSTA